MVSAVESTRSARRAILASMVWKRRGRLHASVAALALAASACTVPDDLLEGRPCPCIEGWVCQSDVCVRAVGDGGAERDFGVERDAGDESDAFVAEDAATDGQTPDMPVTVDAFVAEDGGPAGPALVGRWECERLVELAMRSTMEDASGNGYTATCSGAECPTIVIGRIGSGCRFDGDQELRVATDDAFEPADGFSVTVWVRTPHPATAQSLVAMPYGVDVLNSWQIFMPASAGTVSFVTTDGETPNTLVAAGALADEAWQHVAVTWDGERRHLYLDGTLVGSGATLPHMFALGPVLIGRDENVGEGAALGMTGVLDDVRVYDGPLDEAAIRALATVP